MVNESLTRFKFYITLYRVTRLQKIKRKFTYTEILTLYIPSLCMYYRGNISSEFSRNSEAFTSESLENPEEMDTSHL